MYRGPEPKTAVAVIEGYDLIFEKAEIAAVDRLGGAGIERAMLSGGTRAQVVPGERCVQLEMKRPAAEATSCAFIDYFVSGQHYRLKARSLKLDKPDLPDEAAVNGTMQIEVSAKGYVTRTRQIRVRCGAAMRKVCEQEDPPLPRQGL